MKVFFVLFYLFCFFQAGSASGQYAESAADSLKSFRNNQVHERIRLDDKKLVRSESPRNVILFIGDGMGIAQVSAAMTANHGSLNLEYLKYIGFSRTQSFNRYVTDSAAGATAIASGVKTYNGGLGVGPDSLPVPTLLELAEAKGLSTGLICTCSITHATPAAFIAHEKWRTRYEDIARDFLNTDVDVVIGGGWRYFAQRSDSVSLIPVLEKSGYSVIRQTEMLNQAAGAKLFALLDDKNLSRAADRPDFLKRAVEAGVRRLNKNNKGFFLMVEGSQIDWGGHDNDTGYIVQEMLDLDRAIGAALEFAGRDGHTLIICTADHETGGMALEGGNVLNGEIAADFTTTKHTGSMVPVLAAGPGAEHFTGIYENTDLFRKIKSLLKL
ncbi:alkaline phosphatase [bacterium]|nr:alkaline phosphatase [bacterium]